MEFNRDTFTKYLHIFFQVRTALSLSQRVGLHLRNSMENVSHKEVHMHMPMRLLTIFRSNITTALFRLWCVQRRFTAAVRLSTYVQDKKQKISTSVFRICSGHILYTTLILPMIVSLEQTICYQDNGELKIIPRVIVLFLEIGPRCYYKQVPTQRFGCCQDSGKYQRCVNSLTSRNQTDSMKTFVILHMHERTHGKDMNKIRGSPKYTKQPSYKFIKRVLVGFDRSTIDGQGR